MGARARRSKNLRKMERMLSSGSFVVQQNHVDFPQDSAAVRDLLVQSAAAVNGISLSIPRCLVLGPMPSFLVDHIVQGEKAFVLERSGRFARAEDAVHASGTLRDLPEDIIFKWLNFLQGHEMKAWFAVSRVFAFRLCDTTEFATILFRNSFPMCFTVGC